MRTTALIRNAETPMLAAVVEKPTTLRTEDGLPFHFASTVTIKDVAGSRRIEAPNGR